MAIDLELITKAAQELQAHYSELQAAKDIGGWFGRGIFIKPNMVLIILPTTSSDSVLLENETK